MSAKRRAAGPVRQLSLQQQQQQQSPLSKRSLRRQQSEDQGLCVTACSIRNGGSGGGGGGSEDLSPGPNRPATSQVRPRLVKVAWAERRQNSQQSPTPEVEVVARRCTSQPRPTPSPAVKVSNLPSITADRDSILYTRQQLAERLRRAWKEREQGKPNLDIFLAHNSVGNVEEEPSPRPASALSAPSIIGSMSPTIQRSRGSPLNSPGRGLRRQVGNVLDHKTIAQSQVSAASTATINNTSSTVACNNSNTSLHNELAHKPFMDTVDDTAISDVTTSHISVFGAASIRKSTSSSIDKRNTLFNSVPLNSGETINNGTQKQAMINRNLLRNTSLMEIAEETAKVYSSKDITEDVENNSERNNTEEVDMRSESYNGTKQAQTNYVEPTKDANIYENKILHDIISNDNNSSIESHSSLETDHMVTTNEKGILSDDCKDSSLTEVTLPDSPAPHADIEKTVVQENNKEDSKMSKTETATYNFVLPGPTTNESSSLISNYKLFFPAASKVQDFRAEEKAKEDEKLKEASSGCTPVARVSCGIRPPQPQSVAKDRGNTGGNISAAVRRVNFRNSNNFNKTISDRFQPQGSNHPPLTRTLSAPSQRNASRDPQGTKGILMKTTAVDSALGSDGEEDDLADLRADRERLIKSAPARRRLKSAFTKKKSLSRGEESSDEEETAKDKDKEKKKGSRRGIMRGAEIVTMVSLMSPTGSEAEEEASETFLQPANENDSSWVENRENAWPGVTTGGKSRDTGGNKSPAPSRIVCLRKSPKSVSFQQQPSISASYPSRRGSMVIAPPQQEQSTPPTSTPPAAEMRRRLVRTKSVPIKNVESETPTITNTTTKDPPQKSTEVIPPPARQEAVRTEVPIMVPNKTPVDSQEPATNTEKDEDSEPQFQTPKEKECWHLYRRMCEKGVSISYDTVLRGMLTPTEYRLHRSAEPSTC